MDKLVSVIIPAYNAEKYIEQCVNSVVNQTYKQLEIIIVNDGSIDKTLVLVEKIKNMDNRIVVIDQKNKGLSAARNAGLKVCKGDYIFFLDSDDWIIPTCIEELIGIEKDKDMDIVFFDYIKNYENCEVEHHVYKKNFIYTCEQKDNSILWNMRTITAWGKLYSRKCLDGILYDEYMQTAEDVDFNYRVYKNVKTAYYLHRCLLHYRILEHSAIHGFDSNVKKKFEYPLKRIASYITEDDVQSLTAYYSFAAIAYIVICQNGIVRNDMISNSEKRKQIKEFSEENWVKDLFLNTKYIHIPISRKIIIYFSKISIYSMMIFAANIRRRLKK